MEKYSSMDAKPCNHHHHHHHYQILHNCPLHSYMLQQGYKHVPACPLFTPSLQQNTEQSTPALLPDVLNVQISEPTVSYTDSRMTQNEGHDFEDEEEEPIFVLTDEWRDFFAKSEAKRRQAKKLAKKKGKSKITDGNTPALED